MTPSSDDTAVLSAVPAVPEPFDDRDDGLASALAKAAPRRWWNRGTLVLGAFALLLGGFLGGLEVQKHYGTGTAAATAGRTGARTGGFPGGAFGGGAAPTAAAPAAAGPTTGKVKLVNGTTVYVEKADGEVVTVRTGAGTTVQSATKGKLKDLKAGDTVSVQGTADTEGTVTATTVTESKG
ncbi:hypothetical protein ACQP2Y_25570 [Actinoplanes sp. CA-051413]|uniref:hypothetical protein n=1 Tax=Actinoplanes sp. CA-051413 TaxID=3239899 RepID=UPI003D95AE86